MAKNENIQKHTFYLRKGDVEFIQDVFGASGYSSSAIIRGLVSKFVDAQREKLKEQDNE